MQVQSHPDGVAAGPLGRVQRRVGDLEQPVEVRGVVEERRSSHRDAEVAHGQRAVRVATSTTPRASTRRRIRSATASSSAGRTHPLVPGKHDHELLAAELADEVVVAHLGAQRLGHGGQDAVAGQVAVAVVHGLKWSRSRMSTAAPPWRAAPVAAPGRPGPARPRR